MSTDKVISVLLDDVGNVSYLKFFHNIPNEKLF